MNDIFQKIKQIQQNLHKEVNFNPGSLGIGLELGEEKINSFGGILRNYKYYQARVPNELANDCGFSSGPEMLVSNYNLIKNYITENFGRLSSEEAQEVERVKKLFTALPMFHVTRADPFLIAELGGVLSYEAYNRIAGDEEFRHNTTEDDRMTGRSQFAFMSLGNAYIGGNNRRLYDITIITVKAELLTNSNFIVQASNFNNLEGLFEEVSASKPTTQYHEWNRTSLIGPDFLELASMALVKGALSYTDFDKSEVMIRDILPFDSIAGIARSISLHDEQVSDLSTYELEGSSGKTFSVSMITDIELANMQHSVTPKEKFWTKDDT